jgi:hypothetical protein
MEKSQLTGYEQSNILSPKKASELGVPKTRTTLRSTEGVIRRAIDLLNPARHAQPVPAGHLDLWQTEFSLQKKTTSIQGQAALFMSYRKNSPQIRYDTAKFARQTHQSMAVGSVNLPPVVSL